MDRDLLALVLERPDDHELRRVVADRLIERNDPRGTFIAVQCELADGAPTVERRRALEETEASLLEKYGESWLPALPPFDEVRFVRGFVEEWKASASEAIARSNRLARKVPLRRIVLTWAGPSHFRHLDTVRAFRAIPELAVVSPRAPTGIESCQFSRLRWLSVRGDFQTELVVPEIVAAPWWAQLKEVELLANDSALRTLAHTDAELGAIVVLSTALAHRRELQALERLPRLRALTLNVRGEEVTRWAEDWAWPSSLRHLRLAGTTVDEAVLESLARSKVEAVSLSECRFSTPAVRDAFTARFPSVPDPVERWCSPRSLARPVIPKPAEAAPRRSFWARLFGARSR